MEPLNTYVCESLSRNSDGYPTAFFMQQQPIENTYEFFKADSRCPTNEELSEDSELFDKIPDSIAKPLLSASFVGVLEKFELGVPTKFAMSDVSQARRCLGLTSRHFVVVSRWDFADDYAVGVPDAEYEEEILPMTKEFCAEKEQYREQIDPDHEIDVRRILKRHDRECRHKYTSASAMCNATMRILMWASTLEPDSNTRPDQCPCLQ